jgi:tRNA A-37 threonylcarbamoyl transferase component Bud32
MNPASASPAEVCLLEYLVAHESDPATSAATFRARLSSPEQREEFEELLRAVRYAERLLPPTTGQRTYAGRYRIERRLGSGHFGEVWQATDERLGDQVAVKLLRFGGDETWRARMEVEARTIAELDHPNIVGIRDVGVDADQGVPFVVMELARGPDLGCVLEQLAELGGRPQASELAAAVGEQAPDGHDSLLDERSYARSIARIFVQVLRALEAAHARGIVHRDLKPANMVLRAGGQPLLLDFGLAGHLPRTGKGAADEGRGPAGTLPYMAPEQLREWTIGRDERIDVYQLGVVLYEALCLRRAFVAEDEGTLKDRIEAGDFLPPRRLDPSIPRDLEDVVLTAMDVRPDRRYPNARAFREDLEAFLAGAALPFASRGRVGPLSPRRLRWWARRRRVPLAIAGAAAAAVAVGLQWEAWFGPMVRVVRVAETIEAGRPLEIDIEVPVGRFLSALMRLEAKDGSVRVWPVPPAGPSIEQEQGWVGYVAPGRHRVVLGGVPPDAKVGDEIVAVLYAAREPQWHHALRSAWDHLAASAKEDERGWVSREEAVRILEAQHKVRWRSGDAPLPPVAQMMGGPEEWKDPESTKHLVRWRVVPHP